MASHSDRPSIAVEEQQIDETQPLNATEETPDMLGEQGNTTTADADASPPSMSPDASIPLDEISVDHSADQADSVNLAAAQSVLSSPKSATVLPTESQKVAEIEEHPSYQEDDQQKHSESSEGYSPASNGPPPLVHPPEPTPGEANSTNDSINSDADTSAAPKSLIEPSLSLSAEAIANLTQMLPALTESIVKSEFPAAASQPAQSYVSQPSKNGPTALGDKPHRDEVAIEFAYEQYAAEEKRLIETGTWDPNLPEGSRLFVGNLSDRATKKDVFRVLCPFGDIIQILLKGTYGFVQFKQPDGPRQALENLQGYNLKGRALSLEISTGKPYVGEHDRPSRRQRNQGRGAQNSTPVGGGRGGRQRGAPRQGGYHDDAPHFQNRDRGFSPPPQGRRGYNEEIPGQYLQGGSGPYRGPSKRGSPPAAGGPLPPRYGSAVPEVQILAIDEPDRNYIRDTEAAFRNRRVFVDVMEVPARFNIPAAVRQMVGEGVQAMVFLDRRMQVTGVVCLQIFEPRPRGQRLAEGPLIYDEYNETMARAVELFLNKTAPPAPSYGGYGQAAPTPPYGQARAPYNQPSGPAGYGQLPVSAAVPQQAQLASLLSTVDPNTLANLLTQAQQRQPAPGYPTTGPQYSQSMASPATYPGAHSQPRQNGNANSALDDILKQLQRK